MTNQSGVVIKVMFQEFLLMFQEFLLIFMTICLSLWEGGFQSILGKAVSLKNVMFSVAFYLFCCVLNV